jgi:nucleotide-binding universal stress UspA family protein
VSPRSVLVAFDFSEPSKRAMEWARLLRARLHAAVTLVHVDVDPFERSSLTSDAASWETPEQRARRLEWLEEELKEAAGEVFGPDAQAVRTVVVRGQPVREISRLALEGGADLVVLGVSGKGAVDRILLGSTTQELVRTCPLPVMTVR